MFVLPWIDLKVQGNHTIAWRGEDSDVVSVHDGGDPLKQRLEYSGKFEALLIVQLVDVVNRESWNDPNFICISRVHGNDNRPEFLRKDVNGWRGRILAQAVLDTGWNEGNSGDLRVCVRYGGTCVPAVILKYGNVLNPRIIIHKILSFTPYFDYFSDMACRQCMKRRVVLVRFYNNLVIAVGLSVVWTDKREYVRKDTDVPRAVGTLPFQNGWGRVLLIARTEGAALYGLLTSQVRSCGSLLGDDDGKLAVEANVVEHIIRI